MLPCASHPLGACWLLIRACLKGVLSLVVQDAYNIEWGKRAPEYHDHPAVVITRHLVSGHGLIFVAVSATSSSGHFAKPKHYPLEVSVKFEGKVHAVKCALEAFKFTDLVVPLAGVPLAPLARVWS